MIRSPASASVTMARYRASKMCSGMKTLGNRTALGSGKIGIVAGSMTSVNRPRFPIHVVHEHVLAQGVRRGEVRLAATDRGDAPHERHQVVIAGEHEGVDHDARFLARVHF